MIFEQVATGDCQSYLIGCDDTHAAALIDPELSRIDHYLALAARAGLRIRYVDDMIVLDVRERNACEAGHVPDARLLPRGQLELRVNQETAGSHAPDPGLLRTGTDRSRRWRRPRFARWVFCTPWRWMAA